jgi:hypothetical protein
MAFYAAHRHHHQQSDVTGLIIYFSIALVIMRGAML